MGRAVCAVTAAAGLPGLAATSRTAPAHAAAQVPGELAATLAAAVTVADLGKAAAVARRVLGAAGVMIAEQDAGRVRVLAKAGLTGRVRPARRPGARRRVPALAPRAPMYLGSDALLLERFPHFSHLLAGLDDHAWAVLPLASDYDGPAAWLLAFPPGWSPGGQDRARLLASARLLARVLDRCRTHDQEHHLVTEIRGGLAASLPAQLTGLTVVCRYQPGTAALGVGGDFCDAFMLPDGCVALLVGDVQGHGPQAAVMADRLRTAARAYALDGCDPAGVIYRANRFLADLNDAAEQPQYATCCFASVDPAAGLLRLCRAGHPHPVLIAAGVRMLAAEGGLPLGIDPWQSYPQATFAIEPRSTVLLYTDGLTERPGADAEAQAQDILGELRDIGSADPAAIVAGLRAFTDQRRGYDDIAVLAVRLTA